MGGAVGVASFGKKSHFGISTMAEERGSDCQCLTKFEYLECVQAKREDGQSLVEKFKNSKNTYQLLANEVRTTKKLQQ